MEYQIDIEFLDELPSFEMIRNRFPAVPESKRRNYMRRLYDVYLRSVLSERQNHRCCYCKEETQMPRRGLNMQPYTNLATIEHLVPRSKGGKTNLYNCVMACSRCNSERTSKSLGIYMQNFDHFNRDDIQYCCDNVIGSGYPPILMAA